MFIGLLSFSGSLATKYISLNCEQCKPRLCLIDWNPVEFKYNPFITILDKCNWSCNTFIEIFSRICVPRKVKKCKFKCF